MTKLTMDYKKNEIQEYFDTYIKENKEWFEQNEPETWKDDLHHHAFNEDYYIIGRYQAKEWLGDMVFDVIEHIRQYEEFKYDGIITDFSEHERIVNMYVYIIGEEIVADYLNKLDQE